MTDTKPPQGEDDVERFVLLDGEEKPLSHAVAAELGKIEADAYMQFYMNRPDARRACERSAVNMEDAGFPAWFVAGYRVAYARWVNLITITE